MGTAIVATSQVPDPPALIGKLKNLQIGELSYYLLHRPDAITDWKKGHPDAAEIEKHTHGRLFGEKGEIRWQKAAKGYSLLWLSEGALPEGFKLLGQWEMTKSQDVFLLGGGDSHPWRDTRIPRELNYPIEWCKFPRVSVIQYKELNSQTIRFTRYTDFIK